MSAPSQAISAVVAKESYGGKGLPSILRRDAWLAAEAGDGPAPTDAAPSLPPAAGLTASRAAALAGISGVKLAATLSPRYTRPDFPAGAQGADVALEHCLGTSLKRAYRAARRARGPLLAADIGLPLDLITWATQERRNLPPPLTVLREDSGEVPGSPSSELLLRIPPDVSTRTLGCLLLREWALRAKSSQSAAKLTPPGLLAAATAVGFAAELHCALSLSETGLMQAQAAWQAPVPRAG